MEEITTEINNAEEYGRIMEANVDPTLSVETVQEIPPTIEERYADRFAEDEETLQEDLEKLKVR